MPYSFFVLSGEHEELARDEIVAISKSYDSRAIFNLESRLVIARSAVPWNKIFRRATFVRISGNIVGTFDEPSEIYLPVSKPDSFACRTINLSSKKVDSSSLERQAGTILNQKWDSKVSLSNPDLTVYLIITDTKQYLGYSEINVGPKRPKKVIKRPHELDWKLSRCMVNLSRLKEGKTLCDPFCGTGTILLEAESMGIHSIGIDFDGKMCDITKRNLAENGYKSGVINSTYHHIQKIKDKIDAIVTDLTYGTASKSSTSPKKLIKDFLSIVPKKKKLVIMYKKGLEIEDLSKAKKYEIYRHKSLTRVIAVS